MPPPDRPSPGTAGDALLVCTANLCRSPMAFAVARALAQQRFGAPAGRLRWPWQRPRAAGPAFDAAGTFPLQPPQRIDRRAEDALRRRGYAPVERRSRRVAAEDFERFRLVLAMDQSNLEALQGMCPPAQRHKLRLFLDFAPGLEGRSVPDPYFGSAQGFEHVLDLCEAGARGLLQALADGAVTP